MCKDTFLSRFFEFRRMKISKNGIDIRLIGTFVMGEQGNFVLLKKNMECRMVVLSGGGYQVDFL